MIDKEERFNSVVPDPDRVVCKNCKHKMKDAMVMGELVHRYTFGNCDAYPYPSDKPHNVLWDGADCPHYELET